jgi:hypothetical protein
VRLNPYIECECISFPFVLIISKSAWNIAERGGWDVVTCNGSGINNLQIPESTHVGLPVSLFCILAMDPTALVKFKTTNGVAFVPVTVVLDFVIGKAVWDQGGDIRDVISIGKLVRKNDGPEEVEEILSTMTKYGDFLNH